MKYLLLLLFTVNSYAMTLGDLINLTESFQTPVVKKVIKELNSTERVNLAHWKYLASHYETLEGISRPLFVGLIHEEVIQTKANPLAYMKKVLPKKYNIHDLDAGEFTRNNKLDFYENLYVFQFSFDLAKKMKKKI